MNILVCFKAVEDIDKLSEYVIVDNQVELTYIPKIFNCFDESALEIVLRLSDHSESFRSLLKRTALTVGNGTSDRFLHLLSALNFDNIIRIDCNEDIRFMPKKIADKIAKYIKENKQDLIIMGNKAGTGDNGQTHFYVAESLGIPCFINVIDFKYKDEKSVVVTYETDDEFIEEIADFPVVLAIGNAQDTYLRVPTLKEKLFAKKNKTIDVLEIKSEENENFQLNNIEEKLSKRLGFIIEGDSLDEKVNILYEKFLKERLKKL